MKYFDVKAYGAAGDGIKKDTEAVQNAINACHRAGGGKVLLQQGEFICGTLYLKSNVELYIAAGAVLCASPHIEDYSNDTHYNRYLYETYMDRCFIYAHDAENIMLGGRGTIKGNADAFPNEGSEQRPMLIRFLRCSHIRLSGLQLLDAAAWTTAFLDSAYIWADGLFIRNSSQYNGDGLDFDGCRFVYVTNCHIEGTDDNLCLQSSSEKYPVECIQIMNCTFMSLCAGIRIGLKSIGSISGVTVQGCNFINVQREGIKIECTEGGNISDISIQNVVMRNVRRPLFMILNNTFRQLGNSIELKEHPEIGTMCRIRISGLMAADDRSMKQTHLRFGNDLMGSPLFNGIRIDAEKEHPIEDVVLRDICYTAVGGVKQEEVPDQYPVVEDTRIYKGDFISGNYYPDWSRAACMDIRNVNGLRLEGLKLKSLYQDERPAYFIEGCEIED